MEITYERGSEWRRWDLHVHTASSYDSKYKGHDADQLLCDKLVENRIAAVAITDHFLIDHERISNLRRLSPEITFFPGVELRTDKGAKNSNLHLILIFSEKKDVKILSEDFAAIMLRQKAKEPNSDERIHWAFEEIISFAKEQHALVSIHAGRKSNGIDCEISNTSALPVNDAIKEDIAKNIDFFEVGRSSDITDYYTHVFKDINEKPIIICSDCHSPKNYEPKELLWIKANPTFEGLLQCTYQPKERVYVGTIPPSLDRQKKSGRSNIAHISTKRIDNPKNVINNWLNFDLELNSGLVAIIGNKGSGKSALSDILGHLCKCTAMQSASFLNANRFRKPPKNYANDYISTIIWGDDYKESLSLSTCDYKTTIENAQYLPQKYIEDVCNDIDNIFQSEIDKVIFSYVDQTERGSAKNLDELVTNKSSSIDVEIRKMHTELTSINAEIIRLEDRKTNQYRTHVKDSLKKLKETLARHIKARPVKVDKPAHKNDDADYQTNLCEINKKITEVEKKIHESQADLTSINAQIDETTQLIAKIDVIEMNVADLNLLIRSYAEKYRLDLITEIPVKTPKAVITTHLNNLTQNKEALWNFLHATTDNTDSTAIGLIPELENLNNQKSELISTADGEEKAYQKYLLDLKEWEIEKKKIEGNPTTEDTITYFEAELLYIEEKLSPAYDELRQRRESIISELFAAKQNLASIYRKIYSPIESEISKLLGDLEENISFKAEIQLLDNNLSEKLLENINKNYSGIFKGKTESHNKMNQLIRQTEFDKIESVLVFINQVLQVVDEDIDISSKKIVDKKDFYNQLHSLDYVGVAFKLKVGERELEELSPGERGIVLLIFYLALNKNSIPIIIDQPEDNLDNQSVYSKLVPCICAAKKKRQVIIVTHNPNIAIACDAEQIIYCDIDKTTNSICYNAGAIEDLNIKNHVIDVLEGTMPAFDLRKRKYFEHE